MSDSYFLSEHFSDNEFLFSDYAKKHNLKIEFCVINQVKNARRLCVNLLEPLRVVTGPIRIISGLRSMEVNQGVGGAVDSQHLTGEAADIIFSGCSYSYAIQFIIRNLQFDQLILEVGANGFTWLHVSYSSQNRNQFLFINHRK